MSCRTCSLIHADAAFSVGFRSTMSAPILSTTRDDDALLESRAHQTAPLLPFGFGIPGLEFAPQNDSKHGVGPSHRRGLGNPNGGVDDPGAKVGEILQRDHGRELHDPLAFPVVVGQHTRTVSGEAEPSTVAECVPPIPEFV